MKLLLLITSILVAGNSFLGYAGLGEFWFAKGSSSTLLIARAPIWAAAAACTVVLIALGAIVLHRELRLPVLVILPFVVGGWIATSRVIGMHSDGRIIAGWFWFSTNTIDLREPEEDPDTHVSHTQIVVESCNVLKFHSHEQSASVYVGPLLMNSVVAMLRGRGFHIVHRETDK